MSQSDEKAAPLDRDGRPMSFADQLCEDIHPKVHAEQIFGACDTCKRYVLAVIESHWLAEDRQRNREISPESRLASLMGLTGTDAETASMSRSLHQRLYSAIVSEFEGHAEAWTTDSSGDTLAHVAADAVEDELRSVLSPEKEES